MAYETAPRQTDAVAARGHGRPNTAPGSPVDADERDTGRDGRTAMRMRLFDRQGRPANALWL